MNRELAALVVTSLVAIGCGASSSEVGGSAGGTGTGGGAAMGGGSGGGDVGGGAGGGMASCPDVDGDGYSICQNDCNDNDLSIHPGATETLNQKDDDCDNSVDNHIAGQDFDNDGIKYPEDCNDNEPLVGPMAIEDPTNKVDDNCNGMIDEPVALCDDAAVDASGPSFAKAIGLCSSPTFPMVTSATFPTGLPASRAVRAKFGDQFVPRSGGKMILLSTGQAKDNNDDAAYHPQPGFDFATSADHPLYSPPRCAAPAGIPKANDMSELSLTLRVPQNAKSLSFNFSFFSAEYPEWTCTAYNDRFLAILESSALDTSKLPAGQCIPGKARPTCNISYDSNNQPVSVNNGFFDICVSASGGVAPNNWSNTCTKGIADLAKTGYDQLSTSNRYSGTKVAGGATGWLKSTAPVKPGETIVLRFMVLDEGDGTLDSAVLIDNLKWEVTAVAAPVTVDPGIN
jgi:hypothetical protein